MAPHGFYAKIQWDSEAEVWYIAETDFPGLVAEAATQEDLLKKIHSLVPELFKANRHIIDWEPDGELPIHIMSESLQRIRLAS